MYFIKESSININIIDYIDDSISQYNELNKLLAHGNSAGNFEIDMNNNKIINTLVPTASGDVANKAYVDTLVASTSGQGGGGGSITGILGETIAAGQPVYQDILDNKWYLAQAIEEKITFLSVCKVGGNNGDTGTFVRYDTLKDLVGLPSSSIIYLSQDTAGVITSTVPSSGIIAFLGVSNGDTQFDVGISLVAYSSSGAASGSNAGNLTQTLLIGNNAGYSEIDMNQNKIINVTVCSVSGDAANKGYVDNADAANLLSAKTYTNSATGTLKTYVDNADAANLSSAKTYSESTSGSAYSQSITYSNSASANAYNQSVTYTNTASSNLIAYAYPKLTSTNTQAVSAYTLAANDSTKLVILNSATAISVTVPTNVSVPIAVGTKIDLQQAGVGKVTFSGAGVTINSKGGLLSINGQWVGVTLIKTATDTWSLFGDLVA